MNVSESLNEAFLRSLGKGVLSHSQVGEKPLCVDLASPLPPRLRVYMYSLVGGVGTVRPNEYKAVLRVRGQRVGEYDSFSHAQGRFALVVGYRGDLDVFVLWDACLHPRFKNGGNIQVRDDVVHKAAAVGRAEQKRALPSGAVELVIACQSWNLAQAVSDRVACTGGVKEDGWASSQS
jgi:hypothetical protein